MAHLPALIQDLALILCAAGVFTLLFKRLNQPQVLGYLIAGFLVGPHFRLFPTVTDTQSIETWAEIGVIFLMFSLGLEFSFKKLAKVGGTAGITAITEVLGMLILGYLAGKGLGWSSMDSIFLGGILSISSTTIIIRAFDEAGVKTQHFARLVFGVLIVEDLVAILLLVLLSTLAVSKQFEGTALLMSLLRLGFFIILWFLGGIFLIPTFLRRMKAWINPEALLIVSVALCMGMVILCTQAGFSAPLGAFIMGSILAETLEAEKIEHLVQPLKDLFGAVFFISVGMLIDPSMLGHYIYPILLITVITIAGKFFTSGIGALLSGQPLKTAVKTGLSLAQIGEFSFIIATLGLQLKVTSSYLYPIAVAVSALTTFTTPYLIKSGDRCYMLINRLLPSNLTDRLNRYGSEAQAIQSVPAWKALLRRYSTLLLILTVILLAIIGLSNRFLAPLINDREGLGPTYGPILTTGITLLVMSPFLWAMAFRQWEMGSPDHPGGLFPAKTPLVMLDIFRVLLALAFIEFLLDIYFPTWVALVTALVCCAGIYYLFSGRLQAVYQRLEIRFLGNLGEREQAGRQLDALAPWDAHLVPLAVPADTSLHGQTLAELALREQYGINIALIERGGRVIQRPTAGDQLFPHDTLSVLGTDEQLEAFRQYLASTHGQTTGAAHPLQDVVLRKIVIPPKSPLVNASIKSSCIRENIEGLVAGIERKGERILNPPSSFVFEPGDEIWVVGEEERITTVLGM